MSNNKQGFQPAEVELQKDRTYSWCTCALSQRQPFCDGAHKGTGLSPHRFVAEKDGIHYLCMCKQTETPPYCDGTHKK